MAQFGSFVRQKADMLKLDSARVLRLELQRFVNTLIHITPPEYRSELEDKIRHNVPMAFESLGDMRDDSGSFTETSKSGRGDVVWYRFTPNAIFGFKSDEDMRKATVDELYRMYWESGLTLKGRQNVGTRGKQKIYITQKIVTKASQIKALVRKMVGHVGRLKAGWMPSWVALGSPHGKFSPPPWVTRHEVGARGYFVNNLADKDMPEFQLENHAKGSSQPKLRWLISNALQIRLKAMVRRTAYVLKYPDRIGEEAGDEL